MKEWKTACYTCYNDNFHFCRLSCTLFNGEEYLNLEHNNLPPCSYDANASSHKDCCHCYRARKIRKIKTYPFGYYDLIEIVTGELKGRHIPVPLALGDLKLKLLRSFKEEDIREAEEKAKELINKIPLSEKRRDENFFYCDICKTHSFFRHEHPCQEMNCDNEECWESWCSLVEKYYQKRLRKTLGREIFSSKKF